MKSIFTSFDMKMFKEAKKVAKKSTYQIHKLGCVITYKHHIIGKAANSNKTHPMQKEYNRKYRHFTKTKSPIYDSGHAEILALCSIPYPIGQQIDWSKVRVYIYRISPGKESTHGLAMPCEACMHALQDMNIQHVYYTTDYGFAYENIME